MDRGPGRGLSTPSDPGSLSVERLSTSSLEHKPGLPTPFLVVDLDLIEARYLRLTEVLPASRVLFAVKANPAPEVLQRLADVGSSFDVASPGEIERCLKLGIDPARLSFGNTIKKERDIAYGARCGVTTFTVDAEAELDKVIRQAPGSTVYVRITTDGKGAEWPLSRKFGCSPGEALLLLHKAAYAGLGFGVSFHVGSQQRDITAWERPLATVASLYEQMAKEGFEAAGANLGGGLPCRSRPRCRYRRVRPSDPAFARHEPGPFFFRTNPDRTRTLSGGRSRADRDGGRTDLAPLGR